MKKIFIIILMLSLMSCSSDTWLPMASFSVKVDSKAQSKEVWNNLRTVVLKRGYSYSPGESKASKMYILSSENDITVMLNDNTNKGFIEVVYFQSIDNGFNDSAEKEFNELMFDVKGSLLGLVITTDVAFVKGNAPTGLYK